MARVLVVDDQRFHQIINAAPLRKAGFQVEVANNENEAIDKISASYAHDSIKHAAIVTDQQMESPEGGFHLIQYVRGCGEYGKHVPVIMVSSDHDAETKLKNLPGDNTFLRKGYPPTVLAELVQEKIIQKSPHYAAQNIHLHTSNYQSLKIP